MGASRPDADLGPPGLELSSAALTSVVAPSREVRCIIRDARVQSRIGRLNGRPRRVGVGAARVAAHEGAAGRLTVSAFRQGPARGEDEGERCERTGWASHGLVRSAAVRSHPFRWIWDRTAGAHHRAWQVGAGHMKAAIRMRRRRSARLRPPMPKADGARARRGRPRPRPRRATAAAPPGRRGRLRQG